MIKPTEMEKNAFRVLGLSNEGQALIHYLQKNLEYHDKENRTIPIDKIQKGQAKAVQLDELISLLSRDKS